MLSKKLLKSISVAAVVLGLGFSLAYAAADDQIKARQAEMKGNGKAIAALVAIMKGEAPPLPKISVKTCVRWGKHDPILLSQWTDKLGETFSDLDLRFFPMSVTSRIAKILIAPRRRAPVSSSASAGGEWRGLFASRRAICV